MTLRNTMVAAHSRLLGLEEGHDNSDTGSTDNRRPVRRDHEKRRQQNMKAQKKYRTLSVAVFLCLICILRLLGNISDSQGQARN